MPSCGISAIARSPPPIAARSATTTRSGCWSRVVFYATTCALFAGIFIVRYHVELILFVPFAAGLFAYYLHLGLREDSPAQKPEKLYRERGFVAYVALCFVIFVLLMFTSVPALYSLFNVESAGTHPLWTVGGAP